MRTIPCDIGKTELLEGKAKSLHTPQVSAEESHTGRLPREQQQPIEC